jgi:hypothetical protein
MITMPKVDKEPVAPIFSKLEPEGFRSVGGMAVAVLAEGGLE